MPDPHLLEEQESSTFEGYFRDASLAAEQPLAWALAQRLDVVDALRGLFSGPQAAAQLRLWCFLELASQPQARLGRDDLAQRYFLAAISA